MNWPYREIWLVDFEFIALPGERPNPVCLCALELRTGRLVRQWRDEFGRTPPYSISPDALFVAYFASAELGCHLALGWGQPVRVLDLFIEFRGRTNGVPTPSGSSLVGALAYFGLDSIGALEKKEMRDLILQNDWSDDERDAILDYCESDVRALARLFHVMASQIDLTRPSPLVAARRSASSTCARWHGGIGLLQQLPARTSSSLHSGCTVAGSFENRGRARSLPAIPP